MTVHYLIRHTKPQIESGVCYGQSDIELQKSFEKKFNFVKAALPKKVMPIFTSPLKRCLELAQFLNHQKLSVEPRLKELDFGAWEMKKWDEIPKEEIDPWYGDYINVSPPKGESFLSLYERVKDFYENVLAKQDKSCVVVAHGGPIRILKGISEKKSLHDILEIQVPFGEVLTLNIDS